MAAHTARLALVLTCSSRSVFHFISFHVIAAPRSETLSCCVAAPSPRLTEVDPRCRAVVVSQHRFGHTSSEARRKRDHQPHIHPGRGRHVACVARGASQTVLASEMRSQQSWLIHLASLTQSFYRAYWDVLNRVKPGSQLVQGSLARSKQQSSVCDCPAVSGCRRIVLD